MRRLLSNLLLGLAAAATPMLALARPVLLISIDGLRPDDVLHARERGLHLPNLERFLKDGSYASGVVGVMPTLTYPSHVTLLTGVTPAVHGVTGNLTFDPGACSKSPATSRRELFARRPRKSEGVDVRPRLSDDAGLWANRPGPKGCPRMATRRQRAA